MKFTPFLTPKKSLTASLPLKNGSKEFMQGLLYVPLTPPTTNIAPENGWFGDYFPFGKPYFQGRAVSFREVGFK